MGTRFNPLFISFSCIFHVGEKFFLLIELESDIPCIDFDRIVILRISRTEAEAFIEFGIPECRIANQVPSSTKAELVCVFVEDEHAFLIYDLETEPEEIVLVRITLEDAERRIGLGQKRCHIVGRDC